MPFVPTWLVKPAAHFGRFFWMSTDALCSPVWQAVAGLRRSEPTRRGGTVLAPD